MAIERVYVEEPIYDEFVERLAEKVEQAPPGRRRPLVRRRARRDDHARPERRSSPITSKTRASKGARVLTGGKRKERPGDWYEPTVIADADHSMKVMTR